MLNIDLEAVSLDDLWSLHQQLNEVLSARIVAEKQELEKRLAQLNGEKRAREAIPRPRRKYPRVFPKYQNPAVPSETWSGRGRQPRWLVSALRAGGSIEDFKISDARR
jgi:DNA-binding protein H-NS